LSFPRFGDVTLGELIERVDEVRRRYSEGTGAELPDAAPRAASGEREGRSREQQVDVLQQPDRRDHMSFIVKELGTFEPPRCAPEVVPLCP
jgi:hypothetical protein